METKIAEIIQDTLNKLGFSLVKIAIRGSNNKILEIFIDRLDQNNVSISDCAQISRNISVILDVEGIILGKYFLEVSSAGVERPLVQLQDFKKYINHDIKIRLKKTENGNLSFKGKLTGVDNNIIKLKIQNVETNFDFENIKKANLLLTDKMFKMLLNNGKKNQINKTL
jgi:ribosome maturation factor RimP